jgi:signal transduction histidine kinase
MLEEVDRMTSLVDTLLRLSHGDAGTVRLTRAPSDLGQLAREAAASLSVLAEERNQRIALDIVEGVVVPIDRMVVREALTNVLDNAIKYSPPDATVAVRVAREDHHGLLTVADEGPGIPAEHRERIFHRFFRVDEARSRDHGGAGLGLAIAKWAVDLHGGRITVHEAPGGGAEFRILLPLASGPLADTQQHVTQTEAGGRS